MRSTLKAPRRIETRVASDAPENPALYRMDWIIMLFY